MEFTASETNTLRTVGLSNNDPDQSVVSVRYGITLQQDGTIAINELGFTRAGGTSYATGDLFKIERSGTTVTYWQNGVLLYTSSLFAGGTLFVDTALDTSGATISNVNLIVSLSPGTYYIGAIADHEGAISEVDETNNAAVQSAGSTVISVLRGGASSSGGGGGALHPAAWLLAGGLFWGLRRRSPSLIRR